MFIHFLWLEYRTNITVNPIKDSNVPGILYFCEFCDKLIVVFCEEITSVPRFILIDSNCYLETSSQLGTLIKRKSYKNAAMRISFQRKKHDVPYKADIKQRDLHNCKRIQPWFLVRGNLCLLCLENYFFSFTKIESRTYHHCSQNFRKKPGKILSIVSIIPVNFRMS